MSEIRIKGLKGLGKEFSLEQLISSMRGFFNEHAILSMQPEDPDNFHTKDILMEVKKKVTINAKTVLQIVKGTERTAINICKHLYNSGNHSVYRIDGTTKTIQELKDELSLLDWSLFEPENDNEWDYDWTYILMEKQED